LSQKQPIIGEAIIGEAIIGEAIIKRLSQKQPLEKHKYLYNIYV
jgi:hypothetical protein